MPALRPAFLRTRNRKLFVLIAVPRLEGKMNASGLALVAVPRQNSSSVSIGRKPNEGIAALCFGLDFRAICDAAVDAEAVPLLVVPPKGEHLAGAQPEHQEHTDDEPV